jgi:hypothetical protein
MGREASNLWVTATHKAFREHLRHVAIRQGPKWSFCVVSDADLMDAWLARVDDNDIYDGDVEQMRRQPVTSKYGALVDLVEPPGLLIIMCGVKAARNSAMPEVVLEALQHRAHLDKKTWIADQPDYRLVSGHISFSGAVGSFIETWKHLDLGAKTKPMTPSQKAKPLPPVQVTDMGSFEMPAPQPAEEKPAWQQEEEDKLAKGKKRGRR